MEIGSEFWLDSIPNEINNFVPEWITKYGNVILTTSGRGSLTLLLNDVQPKVKTALLPAYICDSVILPFIKREYKCYFYDVNKDMTPDLDSITVHKDIGIFLHMGYYGFQSDNNLLDILKEFKAKSTVIVEDITHTLFSDYQRFVENDYYIASIRKWTGLPSGSFLASPHREIKSNLEYNDFFADIRKEALLIKSKYIAEADETLKKRYLDLFSIGEGFLDIDLAPYHLDALSKMIIGQLNVKEIKEKRRENFKALAEGLKALEYIEPVFSVLPQNICPLFYPVFINNMRNGIRQNLKEQNIYCPIHWPIPEQIHCNDYKNVAKIYDTVLSIPCDQRYDLNDMERIISVFKGYKCTK